MSSQSKSEQDASTHPVVTVAQEAFKGRIIDGDVSAHTRNAQAIAKTWRMAAVSLDPSRYQCEVLVRPDLDQRIDVLDRAEMCAFEFKVSGKNATAEFYKDIVKVLLWNEHHPEKIKMLVFITEETSGRRHLDTAMPKAFMKFLAQNHGLKVQVEFVRSA